MNLKESLELIQKTTLAAAGVQVVKIDGDPYRVLLAQSGAREFVDLPTPPRRHVAGSLEDLVALADYYGDVDTTIWHDESQVVVIFDRDRRDWATFRLAKTTIWEAVEAMDREPHTQAEMVRLLRVEFDQAVPPEVLAGIRNVRWLRGEETRADLQHASHSLGKSVELSVSAADQIVERFTVMAPVYGGEFIHDVQAVEFAIDVDHVRQTFCPCSLYNGIPRSLEAMQRIVGDRIEELLAAKELDLQVFFGTP